jgi:hypothetical protein
VIAVITGVSTLNMAVANTGIATLSEVASSFQQQLVRLGRQASLADQKFELRAPRG